MVFLSTEILMYKRLLVVLQFQEPPPVGTLICAIAMHSIFVSFYSRSLLLGDDYVRTDVYDTKRWLLSFCRPSAFQHPIVRASRLDFDLGSQIVCFVLQRTRTIARLNTYELQFQ